MFYLRARILSNIQTVTPRKKHFFNSIFYYQNNYTEYTNISMCANALRCLQTILLTHYSTVRTKLFHKYHLFVVQYDRTPRRYQEVILHAFTFLTIFRDRIYKDISVSLRTQRAHRSPGEIGKSPSERQRNRALTLYAVPEVLPQHNRLTVFPLPGDPGRGMSGRFAPQGGVLTLGYRQVTAGIIVDDIRRY